MNFLQQEGLRKLTCPKIQKTSIEYLVKDFISSCFSSLIHKQDLPRQRNGRQHGLQIHDVQIPNSLWPIHNTTQNIYSFAILKKLKLRMFEILVLYDGVVWSSQVEPSFALMAIHELPVSIHHTIKQHQDRLMQNSSIPVLEKRPYWVSVVHSRQGNKEFLLLPYTLYMSRNT